MHAVCAGGIITTGSSRFSCKIMRASLIVFALVLDITTAGKLHLPLQPLQTCSDTKRYSASTIAGGKILVKVLLSRPASMRDEVDAECCSIGNGNVGLTEYYTLVDAGPSRGHKDENDYICTVFHLLLSYL